MKGLKYVAAGLSGVLFISLCAGCAAKEGKDEGAVSYVGIDVNPSVSLMLDKNNKVVSVIAENEDAGASLRRGFSCGDERGRRGEKNRGAFRAIGLSRRG